MSQPEWMQKFKEIGQKGGEEVTTYDSSGNVIKIAEPSKRSDNDNVSAPTRSYEPARNFAPTPTPAPAPAPAPVPPPQSSTTSTPEVVNPYFNRTMGEQPIALHTSTTSTVPPYSQSVRGSTIQNEATVTATNNNDASDSIGGSWVVNKNNSGDDGGEEGQAVEGNGTNQQDVPTVDGSILRQSRSVESSIQDGGGGGGMPIVYEDEDYYYGQKQQQQQQPQYYVPYDIETQFKVLYPTSGKRSQMSYLAAVVAFLLIVSAILIVVFVVVLDDTNVSGQLPTMSPTVFQYPPLLPTSNGNIESAATTPLDEFQNSCNFNGLDQPNIIDQCACDGFIRILADDVRARWESLVSSFALEFFPSWDERITSCSAENQALVWMSTGINNGGEIDNILRLQRYSMAYLYYEQGGIGWTQSEGWLSEQNVCTWQNVVCDSQSYIRSLSLDNNRLSGQLSHAVPLLNAIETVSFSQNNIFGPIPSSYFENKSLKSLDLSRNSLTGEIPFSNETKIETLNLQNNDFRGKLPSDVQLLRSLTSLNIAANSFTGILPAGLFNLSLTELTIGNNAFTGTIPERLFDVSTLTNLNLGPNAFTGSIPIGLSDLSNLERLSILGVPSLNGRLPAEYGISLTNLVRLIISSTSVSGNIPDSFGGMTNLEALVLDNNNLGRAITAGLGRLSKLEIFHVNNNAFSGTIPAQLGSLTSAREMKFNSNRLSGSIPDEFSSLSALEVLLFNDNFMSGRAPEGVCELRDANLEDFIVDCPEQVGQSSTTGIICSIPDCCTACV